MMTLKSPKVSVFMPVYNGEKYLKDSIQSILNQSFENFELIIVNDGSTDKSVELINSFEDDRIRLFHNERNMGLAFTENKCLDLCTGEYLAKLDCDDLALPERIERQVNYLNKNPEVGLLGSAVEVINEAGIRSNKIWKYKANSSLIPALLLFNNYFAHPAIMMRRSALPKLKYRAEYNPAEDLDLWVRMLKNCKGYNLPEVLTFYRLHSSNISKTQKEIQINSVRKTIGNQLNELGISLSSKEVGLYEKFSSINIRDTTDLTDISDILSKVLKANKSSQLYEKNTLERVISYFWYKNMLKNIRHIKTKGIFVKKPSAHITFSKFLTTSI